MIFFDLVFHNAIILSEINVSYVCESLTKAFNLNDITLK